MLPPSRSPAGLGSRKPVFHVHCPFRIDASAVRNGPQMYYDHTPLQWASTVYNILKRHLSWISTPNITITVSPSRRDEFASYVDPARFFDHMTSLHLSLSLSLSRDISTHTAGNDSFIRIVSVNLLYMNTFIVMKDQI